MCGRRRIPVGEVSDSPHLACRLRLGGERRGEEAASQSPEERSSVHRDLFRWPYCSRRDWGDGQRDDLTLALRRVDYVLPVGSQPRCPRGRLTISPSATITCPRGEAIE